MVKFSVSKNKEFWNEFAKKSRDNKFGASGGRHLVEIENDFIVNELKSMKSRTLLDIGCGNGQRTLLFSKYISKKVIGIDYSSEMIKEANKVLSKQKRPIKEKIFFSNEDVNKIEKEEKFDVIVSCRCIINQPSVEQQIKLFKKIHNMLNPNGSFIIAEVSKNGMDNVNKLRKKFGLNPMNSRWHNLQIDEKKVLPKIQKFFKIKKIKKAGVFYFISRILHPAYSTPKEPSSEGKINDLALISDLILNECKRDVEPLEELGAHLLIHFKKNDLSKGPVKN